jgi:hypothetical protein
MGAIARNAANLITTSGVVLKGAVNNDSFDNVTALPSSLGDGITLISSQTASASASISFTTGIDSTYKAYKFVFSNIHPATDQTEFAVNFRDGGAAYDATKTTTLFIATHQENDSATGFAYNTVNDIAQGTGFLNLMVDMSNANDSSGSGELTLFNPSSTTFVKHFMATTNYMHYSPQTVNYNIAGYCNVAAAIDGVQFKMLSGNIDAGTIYMYGIK